MNVRSVARHVHTISEGAGFRFLNDGMTVVAPKDGAPYFVFPDGSIAGIDFLPELHQTVVHRTVYWSCGHHTTTDGELPRYCPVCTGNAERLRLTAP